MPSETVGSLIAQRRAELGWSQLRLAEHLCVASAAPTVTRCEISRWEREERVPGAFWLPWLAAVLDLPLERMLAARADGRRAPRRRRAAAAANPERGAGGVAGGRPGGDRAERLAS